MPVVRPEFTFRDLRVRGALDQRCRLKSPLGSPCEATAVTVGDNMADPGMVGGDVIRSTFRAVTGREDRNLRWLHGQRVKPGAKCG